MNKGLCFITGMLLVCSSSVEGWGGSYRKQIAKENQEKLAQPQNFPYSENQGWFIEENYLLWKPMLEDLDVTTRYGFIADATGQIDTINFDFPMEIKNFNYKWNSGVRMGIGKFLPNHDQWDISIFMTYFYGDANKTVTTSDLSSLLTVIDNFTFQQPGYTALIPLADKTSAHWRLNYFVWDFMFGRNFEMTPKIVVHPYIGLRGALIYQKVKMSSDLDSVIQISVNGTPVFTLAEIATDKVSLTNDFWGIGPRIGSNFTFNFAGNWSFLGNLAASLLYGHHKVVEKEITNGIIFEDIGKTMISAIPTPGLTARDTDNTIQTNLEGSFGIGWEHWNKKGTVRIAPALMWEGTLWFNMNNYFQPLISFSQTHGNLGFMGLTFDLQIDF